MFCNILTQYSIFLVERQIGSACDVQFLLLHVLFPQLIEDVATRSWLNISNTNRNSLVHVNCRFTMFSMITIIFSHLLCLMCGNATYLSMLITIYRLLLLTKSMWLVFRECASDGELCITDARSHSIAICFILTVYFSSPLELLFIKLKGCLSYSHNHINLYSQLTLLNFTILSLNLDKLRWVSLNILGVLHVFVSILTVFVLVHRNFIWQAKFFSH